MPGPEEILAGLGAITNEAWIVAAVWHIVLLGMLVCLAIGWRPRKRIAGAAIAAPLASVSAAAWIFGNPFNGMVFAALAVVVLILGARLPEGTVRRGPMWSWVAGLLMVAFGWAYPHFLETGVPVAYLYAAPFGLIPCPTLSGVIGLALLGDGFGGRTWSLVLGGAGVFYALFGSLRLGVSIDALLLAGAVVLIVRGVQVTARKISPV